MTDCPYQIIMHSTRAKINEQRVIRNIMRAVRENDPAPVRNILAEAIEDALYGRVQ